MTLTLTDVAPSTLISDLKTQVHTHLGGSSVVSIDKIKILSSKKPIPPSKKTVAEVISDAPPSTKDVEFGIMVMGGCPDPPPSAPTTLFAASQQTQPADGPGSENATASAAKSAPEPAVTGFDGRPTSSTPMEGISSSQSPTQPVVQPGGMAGKIVLATDGFWTDLEGFLEQRLKDATEAKNLSGVFRRAWESSRAEP
jgi:hypothetical protein